MEVSAKSGFNVDEAFMKICEQVKDSVEAHEVFSSQAKTSVMRITPMILDDEKKKCNC